MYRIYQLKVTFNLNCKLLNLDKHLIWTNLCCFSYITTLYS